MKTKIKELMNFKFYLLTTAILIGLGGIGHAYMSLADEVVVVESQVTYTQEERDLTITEWVYKRLEQHLGEDEAYNGMAIIQCESGWNPDALSYTRDMGLWQISHIHKDISNQQKFDYQIATDWAINKRIRDGNWSAWVCARKLGIN